jgi:endonuclease/exonuclease/phosphatase family metal-dependent hydrolase
VPILLRFLRLLASCALLCSLAQGAEPLTIKVMSFNLRYATAPDGENHWDKRRALLLDTIRRAEPDLLGTQETLALQRDYLAEKLDGYEALGIGREDGTERGEMTAILWKKDRFEKLCAGHFWLSETPDKVGSKSWDSSLPRMATWIKLRDRCKPEERPLLWINTHFDHRGKVARIESAKLLRAQLRVLGKDCALVVTGDFNAAEDSEPYRSLFGDEAGQASPLVDTYRQRHPERGRHEGTYNGFKHDATDGARIDWIGVSPDVKIQAADIDHHHDNGHTPSDHFPVTAVLER